MGVGGLAIASAMVSSLTPDRQPDASKVVVRWCGAACLTDIDFRDCRPMPSFVGFLYEISLFGL